MNYHSKLPKDRRLTPLLLRQYKAQETRIKQCGLQAKETHLSGYIPTVIGTIETYRFTKHNQNI